MLWWQLGIWPHFRTRTPWSSLHLARSLLYVFEVSLSLCFMLMVMTFNLWILIAVVTGSALGWILCHVAFGGHQYETLLKVQQQQMNNKNGRPKSSHEPWQKQDQKAARTINNNVQNVESVQLIASVWELLVLASEPKDKACKGIFHRMIKGVNFTLLEFQCTACYLWLYGIIDLDESERWN